VQEKEEKEEREDVGRAARGAKERRERRKWPAGLGPKERKEIETNNRLGWAQRRERR
jgi:hypothetical protein